MVATLFFVQRIAITDSAFSQLNKRGLGDFAATMTCNHDFLEGVVNHSRSRSSSE